MSNKQIAQRFDCGPRFLQYLEGERYKRIIPNDELGIYLSDTGGERKMYYEFKGRKTEESWTKIWKSSHPVGVMCFMGVSYWGKIKLRFVEPKAKINQEYYVDKLLTPLFE